MKKFYTIVAMTMASMSLYAQNLTDLVSDKYDGKVIVSVDEQVAPEASASVIIEKKEGNKIDFTLKNFVLKGDPTDPEASDMPVGNINIVDLELLANTSDASKASLNTTKNVSLTEGDLPGVPFWMATMLGGIPIPADIKGDLGLGYADLDIDIDLSAFQLGVIHVDFLCGDPTGINTVNAERTYNGMMYNLQGQRVSDAKGLVIVNGKKIIK